MNMRGLKKEAARRKVLVNNRTGYVVCNPAHTLFGARVYIVATNLSAGEGYVYYNLAPDNSGGTQRHLLSELWLHEDMPADLAPKAALRVLRE